MPEEIDINAAGAPLRPAPAKVSLPGVIKPPRRGFTGLFLCYFLPAALVAAGLILLFADFHQTSNHTLLKTRELNHVELEERALANYFTSITADLAILADSSILLDYLETPTENHLARLNRLFRNFSVNKKIYSQIRYLNDAGQELVRVVFADDQVIEIPENELKNRIQRYHCLGTNRLEQDQFYISPMDLSMTDGVIDQPLTPVIRFCTPAFDRNGIKRGVIILNFAADHLLGQVQMAFAGLEKNHPPQSLTKLHQKEGTLISGVPMLLNPEGFWLVAPDPADEWGFRLGHSRTFQQRFPTAWETIRVQDHGQIQTAGGLFSFATIKPLANQSLTGTNVQLAPADNASQEQSNNFYWKLMSART